MRKWTGRSNPSLRDWRRSLRNRPNICHPPLHSFSDVSHVSQRRQTQIRSPRAFHSDRPAHSVREQAVGELRVPAGQPSDPSWLCDPSTPLIRSEQTQNRESSLALHAPSPACFPAVVENRSRRWFQRGPWERVSMLLVRGDPIEPSWSMDRTNSALTLQLHETGSESCGERGPRDLPDSLLASRMPGRPGSRKRPLRRFLQQRPSGQDDDHPFAASRTWCTTSARSFAL